MNMVCTFEAFGFSNRPRRNAVEMYQFQKSDSRQGDLLFSTVLTHTTQHSEQKGYTVNRMCCTAETLAGYVAVKQHQVTVK